MTVVIVGKKGGSFTAKDGKSVESYKINFTVPYEDKIRIGYYHVGNGVFERKCSRVVFVNLPDTDEPYIDGIPAEITFDIYGNVDKVVID